MSSSLMEAYDALMSEENNGLKLNSLLSKKADYIDRSILPSARDATYRRQTREMIMCHLLRGALSLKGYIPTSSHPRRP